VGITLETNGQQLEEQWPHQYRAQLVWVVYVWTVNSPQNLPYLTAHIQIQQHSNRVFVKSNTISYYYCGISVADGSNRIIFNFMIVMMLFDALFWTDHSSFFFSSSFQVRLRMTIWTTGRKTICMVVREAYRSPIHHRHIGFLVCIISVYWCWCCCTRSN